MKTLTKVIRELSRRRTAREKPGEDKLYHIEVSPEEWDKLRASKKVGLIAKFPDAETIVLCGARVTKTDA